jgi:hypothetical protein
MALGLWIDFPEQQCDKISWANNHRNYQYIVLIAQLGITGTWLILRLKFKDVPVVKFQHIRDDERNDVKSENILTSLRHMSFVAAKSLCHIDRHAISDAPTFAASMFRPFPVHAYHFPCFVLKRNAIRLSRPPSHSFDKRCD